MDIATFRVSSFRAFRDDTELRLRPLTLLYGHNQSGKSSILRVLPLVADSLHSGVAGLDLNSPALCGATFKEIGWMGQGPSYTPWITITTQATEDSYRVQFADDSGLVVNRLLIGRKGDSGRFDVSLDNIVRRSAAEFVANYTGMLKGRDWSGPLTFSRFVPDGLPDVAQAITDDVMASIRPVRDLQWLHGDRLGTGSGTPARWCRSDGSDLASVLRDNREVLEAASAWLRSTAALDDSVQIVSETDGRPRLELGRSGRERLPLQFAGEGVRSLLPVLLCACWAETGNDAPTALAVEEPESHLHPNLQVDLLDRLVETVSKGIPVFLETHSVYLLRATQLAVLEKRIAPEDVALYWVSQDDAGVATLKPIEVNPDATLEGWRPGVFEQEQELAHKILDARWSTRGAT